MSDMLKRDMLQAQGKMQAMATQLLQIKKKNPHFISKQKGPESDLHFKERVLSNLDLYRVLRRTFYNTALSQISYVTSTLSTTVEWIGDVNYFH